MRWVTKEIFAKKAVNWQRSFIFYKILSTLSKTSGKLLKSLQVLIFMIYINTKTWYFKITKQDYNEYYDYLLQLSPSVCSDVQHFLQLIHFKEHFPPDRYPKLNKKPRPRQYVLVSLKGTFSLIMHRDSSSLLPKAAWRFFNCCWLNNKKRNEKPHTHTVNLLNLICITNTIAHHKQPLGVQVSVSFQKLDRNKTAGIIFPHLRCI